MIRGGEVVAIDPSHASRLGQSGNPLPTARSSLKAVPEIAVDATGRGCAILVARITGSERIIAIAGAPEVPAASPTQLRLADGCPSTRTSLTVPAGDVTATLQVASGAPPTACVDERRHRRHDHAGGMDRIPAMKADIDAVVPAVPAAVHVLGSRPDRRRAARLPWRPVVPVSARDAALRRKPDSFERPGSGRRRSRPDL